MPTYTPTRSCAYAGLRFPRSRTYAGAAGPAGQAPGGRRGLQEPNLATKRLIGCATEGQIGPSQPAAMVQLARDTASRMCLATAGGGGGPPRGAMRALHVTLRAHSGRPPEGYMDALP